MRIAVLGDIHGNLSAFEAVLEDVRGFAPDLILINGDVVNRGPQNDEVMRLAFELDAEWTLGNHDDLLRRMVDGDGPAWAMSGSFWEANRWCARQLVAGGLLDRLRGLPLIYQVELPGAPRLLVSHGSPRHFREGYGWFLTDETISEIVEEHPADVLVGSHTHRPLVRRWGRVTVLNSGAIGSPFNGDVRAQYPPLTLQDGDWVPTFRRVAYDLDAALAAYAETGYLGAGGLLAELFHAEVRDGRSYLVPYLMWSEERGLELGRPSWGSYVRARGEPFAPPHVHERVSASVQPEQGPVR